MTSPPGLVAVIADAKSRHGAPIEQTGLLTPIVDTNVRCDAPSASVATSNEDSSRTRRAEIMRTPSECWRSRPRQVLGGGAGASSAAQRCDSSLALRAIAPSADISSLRAPGTMRWRNPGESRDEDGHWLRADA